MMMMMTMFARLVVALAKECMTVQLATSAKVLVVGLNSTGMMIMSKEAMLTAEVAVLTELVRVLSDKVNELEAKQEQGKPVAWPCLIAEADFSQNTVTLVMKCEDYKVSAGQHWLSATPQQRTWVGLMRGVRVEGDNVIISVHYGNDAARQVCGALIEEMNK